jgi:hypothetical protein
VVIFFIRPNSPWQSFPPGKVMLQTPCITGQNRLGATGC